MTIHKIHIAVVGATLFLLPALLQAQQPYRIMPVGDSITVGYTDNPQWNVPFEFGYRSKLYSLLEDSHDQGGFPFQFVGDSPEPFDGKFGTPGNTPVLDLRTIDQNHLEAYGGVGTSFVATNMASWLTAHEPDVILLMVGINDISSGSSTAATAAKQNLNSIVQTVVNNRPAAHLIVAQITPYTTLTPAIVDYNTYISDVLVPNYQAAGKNVTLVDQYANFLTGTGTIDSSLYSNGFNHPNATGYDRMAETWFAGIQALDLPVIVPEPSSLLTCAVGAVGLLRFARRRRRRGPARSPCEPPSPPLSQTILP